MGPDEGDDPRFSYRVALVPKTGNKATTADQVYELVQPGSVAATEINKVLLKETERKKYRPGSIVKLMKAEGFVKFSTHWHTELWRKKDAKNPKHQYGVEVEKEWFWYEVWIQMVRAHCQENAAFYQGENTTAATPSY